MSGVTYISGIAESSFKEHCARFDLVLALMANKVREATGYMMSPQERYAYLTYCSQTFMDRLQLVMPPEISVAVAELLAETAVTCMDRLRASYGLPFAPPRGYRFETVEEFTKFVESRQERQAKPETEPEAKPSLPHDHRTGGGYL